MKRFVRATAVMAVLVGLLSGIPWLLVRLAGWPLPTKVPDLSNAATMLQQGNVQATTVVKVLACVVWITWIVVAWTVVWEMVVNVPRLLSGRRHRSAPLAPATVSRGVGWLFTFLLATSAMSQTAHAAPSLGTFAGIDSDTVATTSQSIEAPTNVMSMSPADSSAGFFDDVEIGATWVTDNDDTLWSISQQSGVSIDELITTNPLLTATTVIEADMRIAMPAGVDIPDTRLGTDPVEAPGADVSDAAVAVDTYVVQANDGMWNVADVLLGDGSRHVEMAELAIGQEVAPGVVFDADTVMIHQGWVFSLPTDTPAKDVAVSEVLLSTYTVVEGDSLSTIAHRQLGDPDRWTELFELNQDRTMLDGRVFNDPNLIVAGWELNITAPKESAGTVVPEAVDQTINDDTPTPATNRPAPTNTGDRNVVEPAVPATSSAFPPPGAAAAPTPIDATPTPADVTSPPAGPQFSPSVSESGDMSETDVANGVWQRSVWSQIAAGSLLLAGLAITVRRFRLRRLARLEPGHRIVDPAAVAAGTELAVSRSSGPRNELSTLCCLLQTLTPYAAEQSDPPAVRAVQMSPTKIEVLFASPAPLPPKGWTTVDGSHSWTHRFTDDVEGPRQLLTPALVTIGRRCQDDGEEVLLDLETAASVAISGDPEAAMGLARSIALELATYPLGVPMDLCLIGMHVDGTEVCDRVWQDTSLQRAVRVTRQHLDALGAQGTTSMVAARAELEADDGGHDPTIFMVNVAAVEVGERALLDELVDICQPATGIAVVLVGEHANANEQIVIAADSTLVWSQVTMAAPNVTLEAASEAAVMLDHAANADSEPMEPSELMVALLDSTDNANNITDYVNTAEDCDGLPDEVGDVVPEFEYTDPVHDVVLQVMGSVNVTPIELTTNETELLGFLACVRGHSRIDLELIHEAIAPNRERKTVENRLSKLRQRLGVGSNDQDLLPTVSSGGRSVHPYYQLSKLIVTDIDLLEHRLHTAHELTSTDALRVLRGGLDLMEGPLFRTRAGFNWVHSEGVVAAMTSVVTNYARMLIELAVEVDDVALVYRTAAAAGRVLDNPVAEFPFRRIEEEYAEACGDEQLMASVDTARERLRKYLRDDDALATP